MTVPIVEVSIDSSLSPEKHWALGKAVSKLRCVSFGSFICFCKRELQDRRDFSAIGRLDDT